MATLVTANGNRGMPEATLWTAADLSSLARTPDNTIPAFTLDETARAPGFDLWDMWPVERADGSLPRFDGAALWMVLTAPAGEDPDARHAIARIHLASEKGGRWTLHQPVFPDGFTPGDREWSGSAVLDEAAGLLTVYFTAAGRRGVTPPSLEQRLFAAQCGFEALDGTFALSCWSGLTEVIIADDRHYRVANQTEGRAGEILGFRDPGFFRDPRGGGDFLFFTGSCARSSSRWTGVIGVATAREGATSGWTLLPPVLNAAGLNNELERPHMRAVDGLYYLFWSTQGKVFAEDGAAGPTGLYGAVAPTPLGPFTLLNGTGLVASVPEQCPAQEYSWWVMNDLQVIGFADYPGIDDMASITEASQRRAHFAGYPAPFFRVALDGATSRVIA
ncbi:glycoside hydrolase family 68 protein [Novosphingobium sp. EMRT-2]|uniref:glycoside hydrolase family 68 protein n=1 Tax=Novosphingobium sp. EMRT-2 TaxID=2571749 RepID=UPI0010BD7A1C|nr:glycoside hydrolase family 68 protein [Novosphingobium sp. EMRT-2]QCI95891.1 glycoside hydrolase family 68 protein [Novosphingobium sp. EMRT-2]